MMKRFLQKLASREVLLYMLFGVLTTVLDFCVFGLFIWIMGDAYATLANIPSFTASAIFSFTMNKWLVFCSHDWKPGTVLREGMTFLVSRILSFGLEELGLFLSVAVLNLDEVDVMGFSAVWIAKATLSISVAVVNYFLGKFLVFRTISQKEK